MAPPLGHRSRLSQPAWTDENIGGTTLGGATDDLVEVLAAYLNPAEEVRKLRAALSDTPYGRT